MDTGRDFDDVPQGTDGRTRQVLGLVALLLALAVHVGARLVYPEEFGCGGLAPDEPGHHCVKTGTRWRP